MPAPVVALRVRKVVLKALRKAFDIGSFQLSTRVLLLGLVLINGRSFPLVWHFRVLRHLIARFLRLHFLSITPKFLRKEEVLKAQNPFESLAHYRSWAGPDDCDFLLHLSNSSYAKNLDIARSQICSTALAPVMQDGVWTPLAAADYVFISEIPLFSRYEIRSRIGSWDDKWIYLLSEFVTHPCPTTYTKKRSAGGEVVAIDLAAKKKPKQRIRADGSVLHSIAISVYCFKMGRITVPPTVALAMCGFGKDLSNLDRIAKIRKEGRLRKFLEGDWRNESGWDLPEFEDKRLEGLGWCRKLTQGTLEAIESITHESCALAEL